MDKIIQMSTVYVIGHVNPDTDSIASAMGYAWLLHEIDGADVVAARAGAINPQTTWVLKKLGLEVPILITDASPTFHVVNQRLDTVRPESLLREAWAITSRTRGIAPVVESDGSTCGLITGVSLFNLFAELVGPHPRQQEMRISEILDIQCREACDESVPRFKANMRIRDAVNRILRAEHNEFLIVDDHDKYLGVTRQRDVLNPPRLRLILVDHNEPRQAIASLNEAELLEILDHHRLGNSSTHIPIKFSVDVVGSTSTLVSERIEEAGFSAPPEIAGILLAGLLSDTLILSSPTTTIRDKQAADRLGRWAFVGNGQLDGETIESYGKQVLRAGAGLGTRDPNEIVNSDTKMYVAGGFRFAIAQVEVTDLLQLSEHLEKLNDALDQLRQDNALDFAMLMVTDVVRSSSRLLVSHEPAELSDLPYPKQMDNTRRAEGVVSRKKQLLPVILGLLEL
jgi:manganese-dependent inorganic pyrophosphatase